MSVLRTLTAASLLLAVAQVYLTLNKLWTRKHEQVVAESISIAGEAVGLVPLVLLSLTFAIEGQWLGLFDAALWGTSAAVTIAIGAGVWVEGRRKRPFLSLVRDALKLERREVGHLARSLLLPSNAEEILEVLVHLALVDQRLDARERAFIEHFAEAWRLDFSWERIRHDPDEQHGDYLVLQQKVAAHLATSPSDAQVRQLSDIVRALVEVDDEVSPEEALVVAEVEGMLEAYLSGEREERPYTVALVPQSPDQDRAITTVLPGVEKTELQGGHAFLAGGYHSRDFAELVGDRYRDLGFFTVVVPRQSSVA
ncbi:MAG TPA: hypothetical protein VK837_12055 [Longimicrobiales bacterium]|nr:hypothetical protein [Longimicrobiales bacterium]